MLVRDLQTTLHFEAAAPGGVEVEEDGENRLEIYQKTYACVVVTRWHTSVTATINSKGKSFSFFQYSSMYALAPKLRPCLCCSSCRLWEEEGTKLPVRRDVRDKGECKGRWHAI